MTVLTLEVNHVDKVLNAHIRAIDESDTLSEYYELLDCGQIDMVTISADGHSYDVVCDDEGLFRQPLVPTLYVSEEQVLFGDLAFVKIDEEGKSIGLEKEDITRLLRYIGQQQEKLRRWTEAQLDRIQEHKAIAIEQEAKNGDSKL
jgi:hypothetical protein